MANKYTASDEFKKKAFLKSFEDYKKMYDYSIKEPETFWHEYGEKTIHWFTPFKKVLERNPPFDKWYIGGKTNVCYNCIDRHLETHADKIAFIWESDTGKESKTFTYKQLHRDVCKFANVLKARGIKKGDRVAIYLPMIPELAISMLACARIGAVHSIVFGGFSSHSLHDRIEDCKAKLVVTSDGGYRGGKVVPLKPAVDAALEGIDSVQTVIVAKRTFNEVNWKQGRDFDWAWEVADKNDYCEPEKMDSEDPLFILYTSGTTGKPKGILHTTAGYNIYAALTFKYIFDYHEEDIHWCTADIGWITGHSYIVYGPLSNAATSVMFEGVPFYPDPSRFWQVVEKYKVNIFYTAPTAIRALEKEGVEWTQKNDLSSLRLLGSVGEPINESAWLWYYENIGKKRCPIVDTYWQTETGGIIITPIPGAIPQKPGSATFPFFGIQPSILNDDGKEVGSNTDGYLTINYPWPGLARTVWGDDKRFKDTYFSRFPGKYFAGDGARRDEDGYFWLLGRIDDVINVAGHRLGTAEVESALDTHSSVAEAAVVPLPDEIKGQTTYAFVILKAGVTKTEGLKKELIDHVGKIIGPIAKPKIIQFADNLPKTRSGKIMRRILRAIAEGKNEVGDTTTLADPSVVERLIKER